MGENILLTKADMAKYPFLPQTKKYVTQLGINIEDLVDLSGIRDRAKGRIYATFDFMAYFSETPKREHEIEIASFPVAISYVAGANDSTLAERFALFEAEQVHEYLSHDKDDNILEVANFFKWNIHIADRTPCPYVIHFVNYLNNAARGRLVHDVKWKLVNRQLAKGQVYVAKMEVCRLLQEEVKKYIEDKTKEKLERIPQTIQDDINEIKAEFARRKPHLEEFDQIIRAEESEYPPCIKNLFERATKGQHLSHVERFTLVTYLIHQGISVEGIVSLFSNVADFKEDMTRYQVEHLAGQRGSRTAYTTYNCSTLRTHGICASLDDPICRGINNPLTYHLKKRK